MGRKRSLVQGVGINDADYITKPIVGGKQTTCPYYKVWGHMLERCYSKKSLQRRPTYIGCSVTTEWLLFSNFRKWMETQDWEGLQLDKDILFPSNKLYSPSACVFVSRKVNTFLTDCGASRGEYLIGASWHKPSEKFRSDCSDGDGKSVFLGSFPDELEAHLAWKSYKHKLACKLADEQTDSRIAEALRRKYL